MFYFSTQGLRLPEVKEVQFKTIWIKYNYLNKFKVLKI